MNLFFSVLLAIYLDGREMADSHKLLMTPNWEGLSWAMSQVLLHFEPNSLQTAHRKKKIHRFFSKKGKKKQKNFVYYFVSVGGIFFVVFFLLRDVCFSLRPLFCGERATFLVHWRWKLRLIFVSLRNHALWHSAASSPSHYHYRESAVQLAWAQVVLVAWYGCMQWPSWSHRVE